MDTESGKNSRIQKVFGGDKPTGSKSKAKTNLDLNFTKKEITYSTTISFRVDANIAERLEKLAHEIRWSKTQIIVELLNRSLPSLEKQHGIEHQDI